VLRWRAVPLLLVAPVTATVVACTPGPPPIVDPGAVSVPDTPTPTREAVIGFDNLVGGFNPHTLADLTPAGTAVAGLVLPSAFRETATDSWQLDRTLLASAEVSATEPFTVTYRIRLDAAWSDGAPIAAEDFGYLAEQMRTRAGVVRSAGYQLIDEVVSADGGKTVRVVFRAPYPGWRTLFRNLLPAHLLKDAPGGWTDALEAGIPASGGPFSLTSADPARRELVLSRNDRYWATPARLDRLVLRQVSDADLVEALGTGGVQAALFGRPDATTTTLLAEAGISAPTVLPQPAVAHVLLRPSDAPLDDPRVRTAVAAALDRPALIATGAGSGPSAELVANAQILAPSRPGYTSTAPVTGPPVEPAPETVRRLLTEVGYELGEQGWELGGEPLELTVAAPANRDPYPTLAVRVAVQLADAGIGAKVVTPPADELFETWLNDGGTGTALRPPGTATTGGTGPPVPDNGAHIDIAVVPQPAGGDPATLLASAHGCPLVVPAEAPTAEPNTAGSCDLALQPLIEDVLTGRTSLDTAASVLEPALWDAVVSVPLYQHASLLVTTPVLQGVQPGALLEGPLAGAARWRISRG